MQAVFFVEFAGEGTRSAIGIVLSHFQAAKSSYCLGITYVLPSKDDGRGLELDILPDTYWLCAGVKVGDVRIVVR